MPRINFDYLNIRFQKRYKNMGFTKKENTGVDTETLNGYVKLICSDDGSYKECNSFMDCVKFLTHIRFRNKYNFFWNIQFDFESIIKYLDYSDLLELYQEKELQYNEHFKIKYIPKKYFVIQTKNNQNYYFYDMNNFLEGSLNKCGMEMLGEGKMKYRPCAKRIGIDAEYWEQEKDRIIKYCIKDAEITKRLADHFWNIVYEKLNFYPKNPMSKGKLSEEYFLHVCDIPSINGTPEKVLNYAYNSYYGGHFEILKRGYMEHVYNYDIKSAYPAEIANLINYNRGKWEKVGKMNPDCHTGFYLCSISVLERNFSPFMQKVGGAQGLNVYPNGRFKQFLTKEEILFFEEHFANSAIKIESGYEFIPKKEELPFKTEIERLYQWKESEQNADVKKCVKIILNSLYGKFIQVSGDMHQTGRLFNPIYAAKITAGARLKILELALQKPESIISFSTDSVCSLEPLKVPKNPQLGDFALDFQGEGVFVMSDVYNLWNDETKKEKSKLRGFSLAQSRDIEEETIYLKNILANLEGTEYVYYTERPDHLGECIMHKKVKTIEKNLNVFSPHKKTIDINGDSKRVWEKEFSSGKSCLKETHESLPIMLGV
jgi:hypothetical protein